MSAVETPEEKELLDRLWAESAPEPPAPPANGNPPSDVLRWLVRAPLVCHVCGSDDLVEQHHWAPQVIFPDWPHLQIPLCKAHHDEWHIRMRQHGLRWPHELRA
jgi:hypothetical protein